MPAPHAVLRDLHDHGLDPTKPHTVHGKTRRLHSHQAASDAVEQEPIQEVEAKVEEVTAPVAPPVEEVQTPVEEPVAEEPVEEAPAVEEDVAEDEPAED